MKKLLLLAAALTFGLPGLAYNSYTTTVNTCKVTDLSVGNSYCYKVETTQTGVSGSSAYSSTMTLFLYPSSHNLDGHYDFSTGESEENYITTDTYIVYGSNTRYLVEKVDNGDYYSSIDVVGNWDGSCTIQGSLVVNKGATNYAYKFTDAYRQEPAKSDFSVNAVNIAAYDMINAYGYIELDLNTADGNYVALGFPTDSYDIPAGEYEISRSGAKGTIYAGTGYIDNYTPVLSNYVADWGEKVWHLVSGKLTVAYEAGNMKVTGTALSGYGSEITISASGESPFTAFVPQTFTLDVSELTALKGQYASTNPYFRLDFKAKNGGEDCNGYIVLNTDELVGEYDYQDFGTGFINNTIGIKGDETGNVAIITATGNDNEYKLNASVAFGDPGNYNIYVIKDAVFTYIPPAPPSPWDAESDEVKTIEMTTAAEPYIYDDSKTGDGITLAFYNSSFDCIYLDFAVGELAQILPGRYVVDDSKALGTLIASQGRHIGETDSDSYETYSFFGAGQTEEPYYITSGYVDVSFTKALMKITGELKSYKGSTIKVDIDGRNDGEIPICPEPVPGNVMNGYLLGTDATYMFAYSITTDSEGYVSAVATVYTDKEIGGFKPLIKVGDAEAVDMSYDSAIGACSWKSSGKYAKGDELTLGFSFSYTDGTTVARNVNYVVE